MSAASVPFLSWPARRLGARRYLDTGARKRLRWPPCEARFTVKHTPMLCIGKKCDNKNAFPVANSANQLLSGCVESRGLFEGNEKRQPGAPIHAYGPGRRDMKLPVFLAELTDGVARKTGAGAGWCFTVKIVRGGPARDLWRLGVGAPGYSLWKTTGQFVPAPAGELFLLF